MSSNKKKLLFNSISVSLGCSSCKKPKLPNVFQPKPKLKTPAYRKHKKDLCDSSCSTSSTKIATSQSRDEHEYRDTPSTFSPSMDTPPYFSSDTDNSRVCPVCPATVRGFGRVGAESVAVEKDSDDPYLDFRHSMLQMILEKQIYSKDDLRQLLDCFLQLNSPYYHGIIVRAFTEIWNGVFSVRSTTTAGSEKQSHYYKYGC